MDNQNKHNTAPQSPLPEEGKLLSVEEFIASVARHDVADANSRSITKPAQHMSYEEYRQAQETAAMLRGEDSPFAP